MGVKVTEDDVLFDLLLVICMESGQISRREHVNRNELNEANAVLVMQFIGTYFY